MTAATSEPITSTSSAPDNNIVKLSSPDPDSGGPWGNVAPNAGGTSNSNGANIPSVDVRSTGNFGIPADQIEIANKLWSFVSKSSVVGQSVKEWLRVHFGVKPNDDMFDSTHLIDSVVNDVSINTRHLPSTLRTCCVTS